MKLTRIFSCVIILMMLLCCCSKDTDLSVQQQEQEVKEMEVISFSYSRTGMMMDDCFTYSVTRQEDGAHLYLEQLFAGGVVVDTVIDRQVLERLSEIAETHRLDRWDGFDKNKSKVRDGSNFSLKITLSDEQEITARGSNAFPEGYGDAASEIRALYEELLEKYGESA